MNIGNLFLDVGPTDNGVLLVVGTAIREAASNTGPLASIKDVDIHGANIAKTINDDAVDPLRRPTYDLTRFMDNCGPGDTLNATDVEMLSRLADALFEFVHEVEYDTTLRTVQTRSKDRRTHEDQKETDR